MALALASDAASAREGLRSPAAAPLIVSSLDVTATAGADFSYQILTTNAASTFGATALPPGLALDSGTGLISGRPRYPLEYSVALFATNTSGTSSAIARFVVRPPSLAPFIVTPNRDTAIAGVAYAYVIGCVNSATSFEAIGLPEGLTLVNNQIRGIPQRPGIHPIELRASNASGTGAETLMLTILSAESVPAPPVVVSQVVAPRDGNYVNSLSWNFTVWFNAPVIVAGVPRLAITVGKTTRDAIWSGAPLGEASGGYRALNFELIVQPNDSDDDGITVSPSIDLNGGAIRDTSGNDAVLSFAPPDTHGVRVGPWPPRSPRVASVTLEANRAGAGLSSAASKVVVSGTGGGQAVAIFELGAGYLGTVKSNESGEWSFAFSSALLETGSHVFAAMNGLSDPPIYSPFSAPFALNVP